MMSGSLRRRLFVIILGPLLLIALAIGTWRINAAQKTAQELFDRNLLAAALAVSRDVALADGDAISRETEILLVETAGGPVRYHVYAPDGVFVTGYAVPPVPVRADLTGSEPVAYFDATEKGRPVRVLRLQYVTEIAGFSGPFRVTVWQDTAVRSEFVRALALRALAVIAGLIGATALVVWFGVNTGLKPLLDLEEAISRRNPDDLDPIRRKVPEEIRGLVQRLNRLFAQVSRTMEAQAAFISDASHQLRNPIAGVRALGESVLSARSLDTAQARARELVEAAGRTGRLAENLMALERVRAATHSVPLAEVELTGLLRAIAAEMAPAAREAGAEIVLDLPEGPVPLLADGTMLDQAVRNLLSNALCHGGAQLSRVTLALTASDASVTITTADDGKGVAEADIPKIRARFGQAEPGAGSGLGLSIAEAVAERHGGRLEITPDQPGLRVSLVLPRAQRPTA